MRNNIMKKIKILQLTLLIFNFISYPQGYDNPLNIQGINHTNSLSASLSAVGDVSILVDDDAGMLFTNPATLKSIKDLQFSVGGLQYYSKTSQVQHYTPLKYYSNFSLLMEGLTDLISDPDTSLSASNPGDTVQRPFDAIKPNWSKSKNSFIPVHFIAAYPILLFDKKFVVAGGVVNYIDLNHYYQNNNVLSPPIGSERPIPVPLPPNNPDSTFKTLWSQYIRSREGSIRGYGLSLTSVLSEKISIGVSGMYLNGTSDDFEYRLGRGRLVFYYNYFRLDSTNFNRRETRSGTSQFRGYELTLSGIYTGKNINFSVTIKPPNTIIRDFDTNILTQSPDTSYEVSYNGNDEIKVPWRGAVAMSINLLQNLKLGLEYEYRPYENMKYKNPEGKETNPWISASIFKVGILYNPIYWLTLRAGVRGESEIFEPEGNPLIGEPVRYSIYSAGFGITYANLIFNFTYQYFLMKYQDMWQTNVNFNKEFRNSLKFDLKINFNLNE